MWPNPQETADLVTFTEEILNGKLHFSCSEESNAFAILLFVSRIKLILELCQNFYLIWSSFYAYRITLPLTFSSFHVTCLNKLVSSSPIFRVYKFTYAPNQACKKRACKTKVRIRSRKKYKRYFLFFII